MKIVIFCDPDDVRVDSLAAAIERVVTRDATNGNYGIHVNSPERDGFQETIIVMDSDENGCYVKGKSFVVGQIQRAPGAKLEYHS